MKKILVLGVGAQGSAAAKRLDKEPNVKEIICADYDMKAVESIVASITKGRGMFVDAHDRQSIIDAAQGVDLILNGLPLKCTENVLEAALAVKANYQDYAGTTSKLCTRSTDLNSKPLIDLHCLAQDQPPDSYVQQQEML